MSSFPCKICVEKLQVRANAGVDAWGRRRAQPTFISIDISLRNYPAQAANADAIDQSTIHYGTLSKSVAEAVSAAVTKWSSTDDLIALVHRSAVPFPNDIGAVQISVLYPKASKYGDGIRISRSISIANSAILQLVDIRIPTLIGVNKHEREAKQPLVINIWIEMFNLQCAERHQELEDRLVKTVESSSFDTLEALAFKIHNDIRPVATAMASERGIFRVRIAKPLAVPDAEAPVIEMNWQL